MVANVLVKKQLGSAWLENPQGNASSLTEEGGKETPENMFSVPD